MCRSLALSLVKFSAAIFLKEPLGLLLHFLGHTVRMLRPDVKQDKAVLQHRQLGRARS